MNLAYPIRYRPDNLPLTPVPPKALLQQVVHLSRRPFSIPSFLLIRINDISRIALHRIRLLPIFKARHSSTSSFHPKAVPAAHLGPRSRFHVLRQTGATAVVPTLRLLFFAARRAQRDYRLDLVHERRHLGSIGVS